MHRYWLRVCTNLALSIYWIQKKNDAISVHAYHLLLNCLLEKTQIYRELNSLSHALCRAQPRSVCRLCPARQQELQPWQGRLRHQRSHGRPAERMLRRSLLMFILHTSAQSPYWSWRPVPLGEPLVSATGYWRTTNQGVWILENQTHLMCIGMDPLSIIVHVYNGTAHSPRSHLLWNTIVHYEGSQIDARNIGTTFCSWRHQVMDCVFIVASLVTYRVPVNLFATQPISMWRKRSSERATVV